MTLADEDASSILVMRLRKALVIACQQLLFESFVTSIVRLQFGVSSLIACCGCDVVTLAHTLNSLVRYAFGNVYFVGINIVVL